jgi:tetratricopeptide (TPR) repeat protein
VLLAIVGLSLSYHWRVLPTSAAGYFARGKGDYLNGEFPNAVANFTKALKLQPNDADTLYWRGATYVKLHDLVRALPDLERAVALSPDSSKARAALADGKTAAWDAVGAIADYTRAIALDPNFARCYLARGRLHLASERWEDAAADLTVASRMLIEDKQGPADLLLWIARARGGDAAGATAELSRVLASGRPGGDRFRTSARFLCGELSEPDYLAAMAALKNAEGIEARTEAFYLAGEKRLVSGDRVGAIGLMQEALKTGADASFAYDLARFELEGLRLGFHPMWLAEARRQELWMPPGTGLEIASATTGGDAAAAGVRPGTALAAIDGTAIRQDTFVAFLCQAEPGSVVPMELIEDAASRQRVPASFRLDSSAPTR